MKYLICLILLNCSFYGFAQKLTLNELLKYQNSTLSEINNELLSKSWSLTKSYDEENIKDEHVQNNVWTNTYGEWGFIYNGDSYGNLKYKHAYEFVDGSIYNSRTIGHIIYVTAVNSNFTDIIIELKSNGFKKVKENSSTQNFIQAFYEYKTTKVVLTTHTQNGTNTFRIHVLNK